MFLFSFLTPFPNTSSHQPLASLIQHSSLPGTSEETARGGSCCSCFLYPPQNWYNICPVFHFSHIPVRQGLLGSMPSTLQLPALRLPRRVVC